MPSIFLIIHLPFNVFIAQNINKVPLQSFFTDHCVDLIAMFYVRKQRVYGCCNHFYYRFHGMAVLKLFQ